MRTTSYRYGAFCVAAISWVAYWGRADGDTVTLRVERAGNEMSFDIVLLENK